MVRGMFQVTKVAKMAYWQPSLPDVEVTLTAQYDISIEEDKRFAVATPSAQVTMYVTNPAAIEQLQLGKFFYVDFSECVATVEHP